MIQKLAGRRLVSCIFSILVHLVVIPYLFFRIIYYKKVTTFTFIDVILLGGAATCALLAIFLKNHWIYLVSIFLLVFYGIATILVCYFFSKMSKYHYGDVYKLTEHEQKLIDGLVGFGLGIGLFGLSFCFVPGMVIYCYNFFYDMEAKALEDSYNEQMRLKQNEETTQTTNTGSKYTKYNNYSVYQYQQDRQLAAMTNNFHPLGPGIV